MATSTVSSIERNPQPSFSEIKKRMRWSVDSSAPKTAEELSFVRRNEKGHMVWWDVTPPKTEYWHAHEMLGRAYAFELLDYVHNPESDAHERTIGIVCKAISGWAAATLNRTAACGMQSGFFNVLSEFIRTGTANR